MLPQFSGLLLLCSLAHSRTQELAAVRPWEHESSDLPVDPRLHFGHFENGLRWVWARNSEPKFRSYLRLHVDVGSLAEEDSERGMAHFLEHMAFNGSRHFAAGTLVEWFQRHGMALGADLNAHTSFGETVYQVDLPNSDERTLDEGLLVLRDFAFGLTISPEEIEKEKGVVDGEESERDSPEYRLFVRQLQTLCGETRLDDRLTIGVREVRARFTAGAVRAFYRKWYRPENMTVILVGDVGDLDPTPLLVKRFGAVPRPASDLPRQPAAGKVTKLAHRLCLHEPETPSVTIRIARLLPRVEEPDDAAHRRAEVPLAVARRILDRRFEGLSKKTDAPFLSANLRSAEAYGVLDGLELHVICAPERWWQALALAEQELRRALEHGLQQAELDAVCSDALRESSASVERESTQSSPDLVGVILNATENRFVSTSAAVQRDLLEPVYRALTVETCHDALSAAWGRGELSITTMGNLDLGPQAARHLDVAWSESRARSVEEGLAFPAAEFAYPAAADSSEALSSAHIYPVEEFGYEMTFFANGVTLNVKNTDFDEGQILFRVVLGEGRLSLADDELALGWMAEQVFERGGLEAHSTGELRRVLAGRDVDFSFFVRDQSFDFEGSTTPEDLELQCAVLCAYLQHAGWREDGYAWVRRQIPLTFDGLRHDPEGPANTAFLPALYSGDPRFSYLSQAELEAVELPAVRAWLAPILADGPLEVTLVGDLAPDEARAAVARTFGALPERREARPHEERRSAPAPRSGVHQVRVIDSQVPKALVMIVFPVPDGMESTRAVRFSFLTEVLNDRLRVEVRERLGAAYFPNATLDQSCLYPGVGTLTVRAMTDPGAAETLLEACLTVTDALARDGVTSEEVDRLRTPVLEHLRAYDRNNERWLEALSRPPCGPLDSEEVDADEAFLGALGSEPLTELARTYLARERASTLIVHPSAPPAAPK